MQYVCENCGNLLFIEEIYEDIHVRSGTTLGQCENCGEETIVMLLSLEDYSKMVEIPRLTKAGWHTGNIPVEYGPHYVTVSSNVKGGTPFCTVDFYLKNGWILNDSKFILAYKTIKLPTPYQGVGDLPMEER